MARRRFLGLGLAGIVLISAGVGILAFSRDPEWTTSSPQALAEFEAAMQARVKLYREESLWHLERALKADPDFAACKIILAGFLSGTDPQRAGRLVEEAAAVDVTRLTDRERLLLRREQAMQAGRFDEASRLVEDAFRRLPDDPYVLGFMAEEVWTAADFPRAEQLYRRLLEVNPNWVVAYNNLGYLAMLQGHFDEAEEHFTTYRFIAPDHANAHDSLGELLLVRGRHAEAASSFETAIDMHPEFWDSYLHLVFVRCLQGEYDAASATIKKAGPRCPQHWQRAMSCTAHLMRLATEQEWEEIYSMDTTACLQDSEMTAVLLVATSVHRASCHLGQWQRAENMERSLRRVAEERGAAVTIGEIGILPIVDHMEGVRLALSGDLAAAADALQRADQGLTFAGCWQGNLKVDNRLMLAEALYGLGRSDEAEQTTGQLQAVNPPKVRAFHNNGRRLLTLSTPAASRR